MFDVIVCVYINKNTFVCEYEFTKVTEDSSDVSKVRKHSGRVSCPFRAHGCDCAPYSELGN